MISDVRMTYKNKFNIFTGNWSGNVSRESIRQELGVSWESRGPVIYADGRFTYAVRVAE